MVSILPAERSNWDVIGKSIGQNLSNTLPGAVQQGYQRQQGINAIDQLQQQLGQSGGDINKILPALAKAYTMNPSLERSGLGQTYLQQARTANALGGGQGQGQPQSQAQGVPQQQEQPKQPSIGQPQAQPSNFATPSPFNIMTAPEIDAESDRYAQALGDPNAKQTRQAQLQNQNKIAEDQREGLEDFAIKSGIQPSELPRFMIVGSKFDTRNPSEWAQNTKRAYNEVKSNDKKLEKAFIPGVGNALLGQNRKEALKNLEKPVQDLVKNGLEQETRNYLTDQYLSPTEIAEIIHPITSDKEKAIKSLPKGIFPAQKKKTWGEDVLGIFTPTEKNVNKNPFISYEEALEKAPKELATMQKNLADFFLKNVDKETSLLALRNKLWDEKDYDWRQIGPAIREAEERGLKLEPFQSTEMSDIETQPPLQSLPDIFKDLGRFTKLLRGNK